MQKSYEDHRMNLESCWKTNPLELSWCFFYSVTSYIMKDVQERAKPREQTCALINVCINGRGSFSIQKFILQILGTLNRAFSAWNWYKKSKFRVQGMFFQQLYWEKSKQDTLWRRHVHAFHTIWPSYLLAYMQPYPLQKIAT